MKNLEVSIYEMLKNKKEQKRKYFGKICTEDIVKHLLPQGEVLDCGFMETECGVVVKIKGYWRTIKISPTFLIISKAIPQ